MGMFDYITFHCTCPNCGAEVSEFQTKDLNDTMSNYFLETMSLQDLVDLDNFYTMCPKCDKSLDITVNKKVTIKILQKDGKKTFQLEVIYKGLVLKCGLVGENQKTVYLDYPARK